ncbi:MAG: hypothetical protein HC795_18975 [Coleofasciculaceae cyanobacterium RL_1_1]|nr:hypothetical protein [Coleofasciculaceae cyanobacterium RL_1_1]
MKAERATIVIGTVEVDVFRLPDGSYRMSRAQVTEIVGLDESYARRFLTSKWLKSLPNQDYTHGDFSQIEIENSKDTRGRSRFVPLSLDAASLFWVYQIWQRNRAALPLVIGCLHEILERRADRAFGLNRSEAEYEAATTELMQALGRVARERDILLENYDIDDDARQLADAAWAEVTRLEIENERLKEQLRHYQ